MIGSGLLARALTTVRGWLGWPVPTVTTPAPVEIERPVEIAPEAEPEPAADYEEQPASFIRLKPLLDQLDTCRRLMQRLHRIDPNAFEYHRRVGARLVPPDAAFRFGDLRADFFETLPAAGMVVFDDHRRPKGWTLGTYLYFSKLMRVPWFTTSMVDDDQRLAVYRMSIVWTSRHHKRHTMGYAIHVVIDHAGNVVVLPERHEHQHRLPRGDGFTRVEWALNPMLIAHWTDRKDVSRLAATDSAQQFGADLFRIAVNGYLNATQEFQVAVRRHGVTLAFSVGEGRTPYFFKDRDFTAARDGRRVRIFHAVEEHDRRLPNGRTVRVAAHYRGVRKFMWKGEEVRIDPPEQSMRRFDVSGISSDDRRPDDPPMVDMGREAAPKLVAMLDRMADTRGGKRAMQ